MEHWMQSPGCFSDATNWWHVNWISWEEKGYFQLLMHVLVTGRLVWVHLPRRKLRLLHMMDCTSSGWCLLGCAMGPWCFNISCSRLSGVLENVAESILMTWLLCVSSTVEEHVRHLRLVFDCLREVGQKLHPAKCDCASFRVVYLGHVITTVGVPTKNPRTNKLDSSMLKSKNQVTLFI